MRRGPRYSSHSTSTPVSNASMANSSDDDAGPSRLALDGVEDPVVADSVRALAHPLGEDYEAAGRRESRRTCGQDQRRVLRLLEDRGLRGDDLSCSRHLVVEIAEFRGQGDAVAAAELVQRPERGPVRGAMTGDRYLAVVVPGVRGVAVVARPLLEVTDIRALDDHDVHVDLGDPQERQRLPGQGARP